LNYATLASSFTKVFYYDALPVKEQNESEQAYELRIKPQEDLLNYIRSFDRYHVYEGDARRRQRRGLEQKKVDVMIAVDMLTHSFRRNMHRATLLTGDLDFKPLVDALVQDGMFVTLWYPPNATSRELITAADARMRFDIQNAYGCATEAFRKKFTMPQGVCGPKEIHDAILQKSWQDASKGSAELYMRGGEHMLVFKDLNPGYWSHFRHRDLEFLKKFAADILDIAIP
jgi:uncharacterized LabA/DUF88 family protein